MLEVSPHNSTCIILVNYNGYADTIECLESLLRLDNPNFQIVVVDNQSPNNSLYYIHEWAENLNSDSNKFYTHCHQEVSESSLSDLTAYKLITIQAGSNLGFAGANNIGLKYALKQGFAYFWLLNNDTVVEQPTLAKLLGHMQNPRMGILGSKLLYYYKPGIIQAIGGKYNKVLAVSNHIAEGEPDSLNYSKGITTDIDYIVGASMFVSNKFIQDVGLLSEDYFLYFEELDWAIRARNNGWHIGTALDAVVIHKEGASAGSGHWSTRSALSDLLIFRNRFIFTSKFFPSYLPFTYLASLLIILNRFRRGQKEIGSKMLLYIRSLSILNLRKSVASNTNIL